MKQKNLLFVAVIIALAMVPSHSIHTKASATKDQIGPEIAYYIQNDTIRKCYTMEVFEKHLSRAPNLQSRIDGIEKRCQAFISSMRAGKVKHQDLIYIPVVIHVIHNTKKENISDAQVQSQIDVLNEDFNKTNTDIDKIPKEFSGLASDIKVKFRLDRIIRRPSKRASWGTNDQMKFSSNGGSNAIDPRRRLNIWVCNIGGGILGYAQFPGDNLNTDGIVISPQYFGTEGSAQAPFNKGRTTTHEVGHWLNLRHIWGDGNCSKDDFVDDTPPI